MTFSFTLYFVLSNLPKFSTVRRCKKAHSYLELTMFLCRGIMNHDDHSCARVCCILFKGNKLKIVIDFCLQKLPDHHLDHVCGGAALRR